MNISRIAMVLWTVAALLGSSAVVSASPEADADLVYAGGCYWSGTRDVAVRGDYAYVVMHHGLATFDISDPAQPVMSDFAYVEFNWSWNIDIEGNYAYVVAFDGLYVFDISSPDSPYYMVKLDIPGDARDIAVSGSYAYVAQGQDGLQIIDISNPITPTLAGSYDTPGDARSIVAIDSLVYIADRSSLRIFNVADPMAPAPLGYVDNLSRAYDLVILGDYAYMACDTAGVEVIEISDPTAPAPVTTYKGTVEAENIVGRDTLIYISDFSNGIDVINVADPSTPQSVGNSGVIGRVCDVSGYLSLIDYHSSFNLVDVSDPQNPSPAGEYIVPIFGNEIVVDGQYAYGISTSLNVIDVSQYTHPVAAGRLDNIEGVALAKHDTLIYTVGHDSTFHIINVADPTNPQLVQTLAPIGYAYDIATDGEYAYVPTWQEGIVVVDISDPVNPEVVANHMGLGFTDHVFLQGDYLYIGGLTVVDVKFPLYPTMEGYYWGGGTSPAEIVVVDTLAYIAGGDSELMIGTLEIGSVAIPTGPYHIGAYGISNEAHGVAMMGQYAFVIDYASLLAIDVSDPASPILLAGRPGPGFLDVACDNHIYVSGAYGFLVYTLDNSCGDANGDAAFNVGDAVYIIEYIFKAGPPPIPNECNGDANSDGRVNISDAVYVINYIFRGGPPPPNTCCQ